MAKARVAFEWLSGCSGCELGVVDLHEHLLTVLGEIELVRLPILMDTKEYVDADVGLITGSIRTDHDIEAAHKMRKACKAIIAFGTCPVYGGPHSAGYAHTKQELLDEAYVNNPTTRSTSIPDKVPQLLQGGNRPLDSEIDVDLYIPGCPPHASFIFEGLVSLLQNRQPQIGRYNVCFNCDRVMTKTDVSQIRRPHEHEYDPKVCFLSQGCLCMGSVTLDRCLAPCMRVGVPCFSCGGPSEAVVLEPPADARSEIAQRMSHLTRIPYATIVREIEDQAKTHFAYAMASPVFREKPTFVLKKWTKRKPGKPQPQRRGAF